MPLTLTSHFWNVNLLEQILALNISPNMELHLLLYPVQKDNANWITLTREAQKATQTLKVLKGLIYDKTTADTVLIQRFFFIKKIEFEQFFLYIICYIRILKKPRGSKN